LKSEQAQMPASAVREVVDGLHQAGIRVWLDGGWGVDALLGRETRAHHDVDIIVPVSDVPNLLEVCRGMGFTLRDGSPPHAFVLANESGREIDVHTVAFSNDGSAAHRMDSGENWIFPAESFTGSGVVEGVTVSCLSADAQVRCHAQGYTPTEKDFRDMELLHEAFGVELPPLLHRSSNWSG
jgi:lincosamide nucleotidyltransferase A/C/D/E